jgi:CRP/FNR family transcriptional regulator
MQLSPTNKYRKDWQNFLNKFPVRRYRPGETILLEDVDPKSAHVIKKGAVKVYNITADGEERLITFDIEDETFPIGWVYDQIERAQYFYEALTDCQIYEVPREEYVNYLLEHPKMGYIMSARTAERFVTLQARIYALEQAKAADKIAYTLLYMAERFGGAEHNKKTRLHIPLTQQEIANFVGLTRETTSIELKKLERQQILTYNRKEYIINVTKLQDSIA